MKKKFTVEKSFPEQFMDWLQEGGIEQLGSAIMVGVGVFLWVETGNLFAALFLTVLLTIPIALALLAVLLPITLVMGILAVWFQGAGMDKSADASARFSDP